MQASGDKILRSAKLTKDGVPLLREVHKNADRLTEFVKAISALDEQVESLAEQGFEKAYLEHRDKDPTGFISAAKHHSILRKVSSSFEEIGHQITDLVIEQR